MYIYLEEGASMSEMELKRMRELDEAAESAGGFLAPLTRLDTSYDYRALVKYCHERKIEPLDITIRELRQFILPG